MIYAKVYASNIPINENNHLFGYSYMVTSIPI